MPANYNMVEHLYVHVPFCAAKCHYCAFYSEAGNLERMTGYVDGALRELETFVGRASPSSGVRAAAGSLRAPNKTPFWRDALRRVRRGFGHDGAWPSRDTKVVLGALNDRHAHPTILRPKTMFFGGGTPSLLPPPLMRRLLEGLRRHLPLEGVVEWTVECNPSTVSGEKARLFREFGVNRISMGVQALDDAVLDVIGRVHSVRGAIESYRQLRAAGFENVNLDLMFGLPGQTMPQWRDTLRQAIALQPEHISTYCLIPEEDTPFANYRGDDELELAMYEAGMEALAGAGYRQYEISNFAKPGKECAHNIAYWEGRDYVGLGPSACSTVGDRRWQNTAELEGWKVGSLEVLTPELRAAERAAFGMRMNAGVPAEFVRGRWDGQIARLLSAELVQWRDGRLQPTKRGILFADEVASEFV